LDWITDRIAIGNVEDAMDVQSLREAGISGVLCLSGFPTWLNNEGFAWVAVPLIDGPGNSIEEVQEAVARLEKLSESHRVMVHCMEGLSRSAFVVACYLARTRHISVPAAIEEVERKRRNARIDQGLLALLEDGAWPIGDDIDEVLPGICKDVMHDASD
jgi:dual specificity MAP kinase phosphatase